MTDAPPPVVPPKEAYFKPGLWVPARTEGAPHPPARCSHAMAYDSRRRRVVLFGGHDGKRVLGDQWSWDGATWQDETPPVRPEARFVHVMVHDEARGRLVVLGGKSSHTGQPDLVDVWEREGERWTSHHPEGPSPLPRGWAGATWDATNHRVLLFGGVDAAGETHGDLWAWSGTRWTPLETANGPGPRTEAMLAWDAARGRLLVCGAADGPAMGELWEWSPDEGWSRTELPPALGPRGHPGLVALRQGALLFAGNGPNSRRDDTWTWDGAAWTARQCGFGGTLPPARTWHALAYDSARDVVVLFGGHTGRRFLEDTWQLQPDW